MKKIALLTLLIPALALAGRDTAGNYTLPSGNPVTSGTTITSSWANTTLADIQAALTDSLSRSGKGGMQSAFTLADGSAATPSLAFSNELSSGLYRAGTKDVRLSLLGNDRLKLNDTGVYYGVGTGTIAYYLVPNWFEVAMFFPGKMGNAQTLARIAFTNTTVLKATLPAAVFMVGTNPAATTTITLNKRTGGTPSSIGTLSISTGGVFTVTFAADVTFAAGDFLEVVGPTTADTALADLTVTLQARRL